MQRPKTCHDYIPKELRRTIQCETAARITRELIERAQKPRDTLFQVINSAELDALNTLCALAESLQEELQR